MKYIHVENLEKYHPGYKDRELIWAKTYFTMLFGDAEFELIENETDKWRYVAMVMLELKNRNPLPDTPKFWAKYFDIKKRPMSLTLQMLQKFISIDTQGDEVPYIEKKREEERREEKREHPLQVYISTLNNVSKLHTQPTAEECDKLIKQFGKQAVWDIILSMENYKPLTSKYKSVYLTAAKWLKKESGSNGARKFVNEVPGADRPIGVERTPKSMQEILAKTIPPDGR